MTPDAPRSLAVSRPPNRFGLLVIVFIALVVAGIAVFVMKSRYSMWLSVAYHQLQVQFHLEPAGAMPHDDKP
jgi:hypothetical protein